MKKYIVRLSDVEREQLKGIVKKLSGGSEKVKRTQILLKADADGSNWPDKKIAEAFSCRIGDIEELREKIATWPRHPTINNGKWIGNVKSMMPELN